MILIHKKSILYMDGKKPLEFCTQFWVICCYEFMYVIKTLSNLSLEGF